MEKRGNILVYSQQEGLLQMLFHCSNTIIILLYFILAAWDPTNIQWEPIENQYRKANNYWVIWENFEKLSQISRGPNQFRLIQIWPNFLWFSIIIHNYTKFMFEVFLDDFLTICPSCIATISLLTNYHWGCDGPVESTK